MDVLRWDEEPIEQLSAGIGRRMLNGEAMTLAQITLGAGAVVPEHEHPNEQIATVPVLARDEVVVNVDVLGAIGRIAENVTDDFQGSARQGLAIRSCEGERPRSVGEVGPTFVPICIERRKGFAFARLGCPRMVFGNGCA